MQNLNFQSYLVLGNPEKRREKTKEILKETGISLDKVSPDLFFITPEKTKLTIEQVRNLKSHIFQKPVALPYKIVILQEAEKLTTEAQNALLKILEEPPRSAVIVLEAKDKTRILPTILSRVVILTTQDKREQGGKSPLLETKNTLKLLEEVSNVENPQVWLDEQMLSLYEKLQNNAKENRGIEKIQNAIQECAQAKEMIEANVNPRHVLANLVLNLETS
ncbi:MAG: hypothetical protein WD988_03770 [Candidatus Curtissbacteria bacterium]